MVGFGGSSGRRDTAPIATFVPQPNARYRIEPTNVYWVTSGQYRAGEIIDGDRAQDPVRVELAQASSDVTIDHIHLGQINVQWQCGELVFAGRHSTSAMLEICRADGSGAEIGSQNKAAVGLLAS